MLAKDDDRLLWQLISQQQHTTTRGCQQHIHKQQPWHALYDSGHPAPASVDWTGVSGGCRVSIAAVSRKASPLKQQCLVDRLAASPRHTSSSTALPSTPSLTRTAHLSTHADTLQPAKTWFFTLHSTPQHKTTTTPHTAQTYLTMLGSTVLIPFICVPAMGGSPTGVM